MNRACFSESTNLHENIDMRAPSDLLKSIYLRMKKIIITSLLFLCFISVRSQTNKIDRLQNLEQNQTGNQNSQVTATLKSASRLFGAKDDLTTVILIIPSGSEVEVLGSDSTYLHVIFEEDEGYIFKRQAVINQKPVKNIVNYQPQRQVQEEQPVQQQPQVSRFSYLESKYGSNLAARLIAGKIWKGMTSEMVKDSWGSPQKINRVISGNVIKEEWTFNNTWLYIENNMLMDWGPIRN